MKERIREYLEKKYKGLNESQYEEMTKILLFHYIENSKTLNKKMVK